MAAGYLGLALPGDTAMFISLGCIIVGNGFFKPNISTLLGNIYNREDLRPLKDNAYNIFYMGINIGLLSAISLQLLCVINMAGDMLLLLQVLV